MEKMLFTSVRFRLDTEHRRVKCLGKNSKLTPRLVLLLQLLMDKHGEVVETRCFI